MPPGDPVAPRQGLQFTPMGLIPLGAPAPSVGDNVNPANPRAPVTVVAAGAAPAPAPAPKSPASAPARAAADPSHPITAKELLRDARKRLRELDRLVPQLTRERADLRRLVDAARTPRTNVRALKPTGTT